MFKMSNNYAFVAALNTSNATSANINFDDTGLICLVTA